MIEIYRIFTFTDWSGKLQSTRGLFARVQSMPDAYEVCELTTGQRPQEVGGALGSCGFDEQRNWINLLIWRNDEEGIY